jgi:hypothetical protein
MRRHRPLIMLIPLLTPVACGGGDELVPCAHDPEVFQGLPRITSISPTRGAPGTTVTLRGAHFSRIDDTFEVVYADFSQSCEYASLQGSVVSDTELEVIIPEDATLSGYLYITAEGLTVARANTRFTLEVAPTGMVVVENFAQFPIVSVSVGWEPVLEVGDRIDIEESRSFRVPAGVLHVDTCVGGPDSSGALADWACNAYDGRLEQNSTITIALDDLPAARFLSGAWTASWTVGEDVFEEDLRIGDNGYWELRHGGRVVESGDLIEVPWTPYATRFQVGFRPGEPNIEAQVPVQAFVLYSPRANDYLTFRRPASE